VKTFPKAGFDQTCAMTH